MARLLCYTRTSGAGGTVMSSIRYWRSKRRRRRETDTASSWRPAHWALWSAPTSVLGYVLAVDLLALVVVAASFRDLSIGADDWIRFGVLAVGSAIQTEAGREIERLRWTAAEGATYANLK